VDEEGQGLREEGLGSDEGGGGRGGGPHGASARRGRGSRGVRGDGRGGGPAAADHPVVLSLQPRDALGPRGHVRGGSALRRALRGAREGAVDVRGAGDPREREAVVTTWAGRARGGALGPRPS